MEPVRRSLDSIDLGMLGATTLGNNSWQLETEAWGCSKSQSPIYINMLATWLVHCSSTEWQPENNTKTLPKPEPPKSSKIWRSTGQFPEFREVPRQMMDKSRWFCAAQKFHTHLAWQTLKIQDRTEKPLWLHFRALEHPRDVIMFVSCCSKSLSAPSMSAQRKRLGRLWFDLLKMRIFTCKPVSPKDPRWRHKSHLPGNSSDGLGWRIFKTQFPVSGDKSHPFDKHFAPASWSKLFMKFWKSSCDAKSSPSSWRSAYYLCRTRRSK